MHIFQTFFFNQKYIFEMYSYFQLIYRFLPCEFITINLFSTLKSEITTQFKTAPNQE